MEITQETLKIIIKKVIAELGSYEKNNVPKEELFVVFQNEWDKRYEEFFLLLKGQEKYKIFSIIPNTLKEKIPQLKQFSTVLFRENIDLSIQNPQLTVLPVVSQTIIAKIALAIDDTFETKWIRNCFSKGKKVIIWGSGLDSFTGKEPKKYVSTIKNYYQTILEYGIEILGDILAYYPQKEDKCENSKLICTNVNKGKRVITANDITTYCHQGTLLLKDGDIITELAKDKAQLLGITIEQEH